MRLSIVVPSYNQADFLPHCLDSLLSQNPRPEILVYDGGSTDGSRDILERYADRLDYWQSEPDGGQAAALRDGFARAGGDILGWLNSDDMLLPGASRIVLDAFAERPDCPFLYGDAVWIDAGGMLLRPKREVEFDYGMFAYGYCYIPQPSAFFRREAYARVGGVDASFRCCMDQDLWHRLAKAGTVAHVPAFLSAIREHAATKTSCLQPVFREEADRVRERYLGYGRTAFAVLHGWHRLRRVWIRWRAGCYRPLSPRERSACGMN